MRKQNLLTGQIHGQVDWISNDGREAGIMLRTSQDTVTRCVFIGDEVERMLLNNVLQEGMMVTGSGVIQARCINKRLTDGTPQAEVLCRAEQLLAETAPKVRVAGAINVILKGVVMYWDANLAQLKTFFNPEDTGLPTKMVGSIMMRNWLNAMQPASRERFVSALRAGREFTMAGVTQVGGYYDKDGTGIPVLTMLPFNFKLQG